MISACIPPRVAGVSPARPQFGGYLFKFSDSVDGQGRKRRFDCLNTTLLFRDFRLFHLLPDLLQARFPQGVPIYSYGASDGSEPYSIAMSLVERLDAETARRYFPVLAREISPEMVAVGQSGTIRLRPTDLFYYHVLSGMRSPLGRFFKRSGLLEHKVQSELARQVDFQWGDIREAAENGFSGPVVLFFRNAFAHIGGETFAHIAGGHARIALAEQLFDGMPPGSLLVIGNNPVDWGTGGMLRKAGFRPLARWGALSRVYERPTSPKKPLTQTV